MDDLACVNQAAAQEAAEAAECIVEMHRQCSVLTEEVKLHRWLMA